MPAKSLPARTSVAGFCIRSARALQGDVEEASTLGGREPLAPLAARLDQIEQHLARLTPRIAAKGVAVDGNVGRAGADVQAVFAIGLILATGLEQEALTEAVDRLVIVGLGTRLPAAVGKGERRTMMSLTRQGLGTEALIQTTEPMAGAPKKFAQFPVSADFQDGAHLVGRTPEQACERPVRRSLPPIAEQMEDEEQRLGFVRSVASAAR